MQNIMHRRNRVLRDFRRAHRGEAVHLVRGSATRQLTATRARSEHDRVEENGLVTRVVTVDWIIPVADYVFAGQRTEPQAADRILAVEAGRQVTYEAVPADGQNSWQWLNKSHEDFRVFSKRIATT
jgi:hypothetical protein